MGVIGMNLTDGDEVIGMQMQSQGDALMIVSEKGLGKCTLISEFTTQNRGGKGVKCYKITEKTGNIVGVKAVNQDNELMLITTEGIIIRIKVSDTTLLGRITSGVKLINLDENVTVASIAKVREDKSLIDNADTSELLSEEEEKESAAIAAENAKKASVENTETDDELMKELLERAEADGSEDVGVIELLDERFLQSEYRALFPREWERQTVCRIDTVEKYLEEFWNRS